jgi:hypothetical protein
MRKKEFERLKYRNQYILAPSPIECPFICKSFNLDGNYFLYAHIDLITTIVELNNKKVMLLGDMFDYENSQKSNYEILEDLVLIDSNSILHRIGRYSGRFVLIFQERDSFTLLHDATATRKVYYSKLERGVWLASQPHLLARVLGFKITTNQEKLAYYESKEFVSMFNSNIGDTTPYEEIKQLMPNHFLEINSFKVKRFWPDMKIDYQPFEDVAKKCAEMIEGYMESITNRYEVMLPVTAGKDSRILLAASKRFKERVFYYINKVHHLKETSADIAVPRKLLSKLGLDFHILNPYGTVDEDFKQLYFENNEFASHKFLPLIHNYYVNFREKINLPGNIASAESELFLGRKKTITGKNLARWNKLDRFEYAINYYNQWISGCHELCRKSNINPLNLFYWEERLGNCGTQIQLEKDMAQEDVNPFNSRDLAILYASVSPKDILAPYYKLHKRIMEILWPEVLTVPINPGMRMILKKIIKPLGILDLYHRLRYSRVNNY